MPIELLQVDAFTDQPFAGNPAAVCFLDAPRDARWMQAVAAEMNLSETAFLAPHGRDLELRWFTPRIEVDLCGHATLASAHALWETGRLAPREQARFHTKSGLLTALRRDGWIEMDFPADPPVAGSAPPELEAALGSRSRAFATGRKYWLAELESEQAVRTLAPDFQRIAALPSLGVIVTARGGEGCDFVSRFFAPRAGIDEDPVTGSAHCLLGPYWAAKLGREELVGSQVSRRGGIVRVRLAGERALLGGRAVTVLRGALE